MPVKIKKPSSVPEVSPVSPVNTATSVEDIFKILGDKAAREFITSRVHTLDPKLASNKVPGYLANIHYGHHKDLETYADVALERFNNGQR